MATSPGGNVADLRSYNDQVAALQLDMNKEYTRGSFMQALANNQKKDFR